jgi:transposase
LSPVSKRASPSWSTDRDRTRGTRHCHRRATTPKSGRRQGKQPGDPGAHLRGVADPDRVERHAPTACRCCRAGLTDAPVTGTESRQVFDLPERRAQVTEHVAERRRCGCGAETKAGFPRAATAPTSFGPAVRAAGLTCWSASTSLSVGPPRSSPTCWACPCRPGSCQPQGWQGEAGTG